MRSQLFSRLRATPATAIALVALVLATTGAAVAKPATEQPDKDEVTLVTLTGGPVTTTTSGDDVTIPLNGEPTFVFIQKAGEAVELIATVDATPDAFTNFCEVVTIVYGDAIQARVDASTNKGELGEGSDIGGLPAPETDTTVTLQAVTKEIGSCDQEVRNEAGELEDSGPDTWTVSIRVTIVTLRN